MERYRKLDRGIGEYWETKFGEIIIPFGFSFHKTPPPGVDGMVWNETGKVVHVQVRHKSPFVWSEIGKCYGYEKYRLRNDMNIVRRGGISLYVIHDHSQYGRESKFNDILDWVAQDIGFLSNCIDKEAVGPSYYGYDNSTSLKRLPICYWTIDKFEPLGLMLRILRDRLSGINE